MIMMIMVKVFVVVIMMMATLTFMCVHSQKLHMKSQVVDAFLAKFQLKPHEVKVLRGTKDGSLHPVS